MEIQFNNWIVTGDDHRVTETIKTDVGPVVYFNHTISATFRSMISPLIWDPSVQASLSRLFYCKWEFTSTDFVHIRWLQKQQVECNPKPCFSMCKLVNFIMNEFLKQQKWKNSQVKTVWRCQRFEKNVMQKGVIMNTRPILVVISQYSTT